MDGLKIIVIGFLTAVLVCRGDQSGRHEFECLSLLIAAQAIDDFKPSGEVENSLRISLVKRRLSLGGFGIASDFIRRVLHEHPSAHFSHAVFDGAEQIEAILERANRVLIKVGLVTVLESILQHELYSDLRRTSLQKKALLWSGLGVAATATTACLFPLDGNPFAAIAWTCSGAVVGLAVLYLGLESRAVVWNRDLVQVQNHPTQSLEALKHYARERVVERFRMTPSAFAPFLERLKPNPVNSFSASPTTERHQGHFGVEYPPISGDPQGIELISFTNNPLAWHALNEAQVKLANPLLKSWKGLSSHEAQVLFFLERTGGESFTFHILSALY